MQANLSIVLDENKVKRIDLLKDVSLFEIDQYTMTKSSSLEIRYEYQTLIEAFLDQHREYISNFKREANKKGSLVIVYEDENKRLHRMRVLYKENLNKLDVTLLLKEISSAIRSKKDPNFTIQLIKNFDFFLGSDFLKKTIEKIQRFPSQDERIQKNQNQRLLNLIRNKLSYTLERNFEKGYFYLRLIDAYLERNGLQTTKKVIVTNQGKVEFTESSLEKKLALSPEKSQTFTSVVASDAFHYEIEEDGQYSFLNMISTSDSMKYEHFLEQQEDYKYKKGRKK